MAVYYKENGERDWNRENHEDALRRYHEHHIRETSDGVAIELAWKAVSTLLKPFAYLLFLPVRYGYGKQYLWTLLFLFFVVPIILLVGAVALKIHAEPQVFLANWQLYVVRHPAAVQWTWLIRDMTQTLAAA
jgi:hypothetical protein